MGFSVFKQTGTGEVIQLGKGRQQGIREGGLEMCLDTWAAMDTRQSSPQEALHGTEPLGSCARQLPWLLEACFLST